MQERNATAFGQLAHGLKGATGNISAAQMHENCVKLDTMGKDRDLTNAKAALELLDKQFEEFKAEAARLKIEFSK
jgi:HPt (histidine-containing phosphotransfer) domain-containing protein